MKLVLLGAPGAGKGTQATVISQKYALPHISTGDIFRANLANKTELGLEAKRYMDEGLLVPDSLTIKILMDRISQDDCANGYVLDGFPRTLAQAAALSEIVKLSAVINIEVNDDQIVERMAGRRVCPSCGEPYHTASKKPAVDGICDRCGTILIRRTDDEPATVRKRLTVYHDQTAPLVKYYEAQGLTIDIDGMKTVDEVSADICEALDLILSKEEA